MANQFIGNINRSDLPPFSAQTKNVVILGSSIAAGYNASSVSLGWTGKLATDLTNDGWTCYNVAQYGTNTTDGISRFYTDVASKKPDVVIITYGFANELGTTGNGDQADFDNMMLNMQKLITMTQQIGAIPVLGGTYPKNAFTAAQVPLNNTIKDVYDSWGIPWFNFASLDDGTGSWIASVNSGDGTHPNDAGHAEMYSCVPRSLFKNLFTKRTNLKKGNGSLKVLVTAPTAQAPIVYTPNESLTSFTAFCRIRIANPSYTGNSFMGVGTNTNIRVRGQILTYVANSGTTIASTVDPNKDCKWHSIAITYNAITQVTSFYVDGISIGTVTDSVTASNVTFGSRYGKATFANETEFKDAAVYRAALPIEDIVRMHQGQFRLGSLDFFNNLSLPNTSYTNITNQAGTSSKAILDTAANVVTNEIRVTDSDIVKLNVIGTLANQTYNFLVSAPFAGRVLALSQSANSLVTAGNYTVKINGTNVTGLAAITNATSKTTTPATGAYDFAVGDTISVTFASTSALIDWFGELLITKYNNN